MTDKTEFVNKETEIEGLIGKATPQDKEELVNEPEGISQLAEEHGDMTEVGSRDILPPEGQSDKKHNS